MPITAIPSLSVTPGGATLTALTDRLKRALSIDFNDADERLQDCITAATGRIERYTGCLLSPGTVTATWSAFYDDEELPSGPVRGDVVATTLTGLPVVFAPVLGNRGFVQLSGNYPAGITLTYPAGYDQLESALGPLSLPDELQEAVIQFAANLYDGGSRDWMMLARNYKRWGWGS